MQLKKGQEIELEIEKLAFGGEGIAELDGRKVFVKKGLPGDRVLASFSKIKSRYAEAQFVKLLKPSKNRVQERCSYFGTCGGCQFQTLPYQMQLDFKKQHVIDAFERIGGIKNPPVEEVIGCEEEFYYRNKMEFSFGYDAEMNFALGMHLPGRRYDILDLKECHLQSAFSAEILNAVREFCMERKWQPRKYSTNEGFLKSLYLREGKRTGERMINLTTIEEVPESFKEDMDDFVLMLRSLNGEITSIYWTQLISKRGQANRVRENLLYGKKTLTEKMLLKNGDKLSFEILPQAFFQVNTFQAEVLYSQVTDLVLSKPHGLVFDLFCGTGTIGLFLAKHVEEVMGIELNEDAVKVARENAIKNGVHNIDFFTGSVSKVLEELDRRPSIIVVDPPRAGLTEKLVEQIHKFDSKQIVYVSCNPATLARDCSWFADYGFKVKTVRPVDMFPHTYHIENVVLLER